MTSYKFKMYTAERSIHRSQPPFHRTMRSEPKEDSTETRNTNFDFFTLNTKDRLRRNEVA